MTTRKIKKLRKDLGWTGAQFSTYLGVSNGAVFQWEGGRSRPRFNVHARLYLLGQALAKNDKAGELLADALAEGGRSAAVKRALAIVERATASAQKPAKRKAPAKRGR